MMTNKEMLLIVERKLRYYADENGKIDIKDLERCITGAVAELDIREKESAPIQKFLFVEDGSVDSDELEEILSEKNPEIKVVVYRQGAAKPELVDISEVK